MRNFWLKYEPGIIDDVHMPFVFMSQKIVADNDTGVNCCAYNWHKDIEILYFISGRGRVSCGSDEFFVEKGDIAIVNSDLIHSIITEEEVEYFYLIPNMDFLNENEIKLDGYIFENKINDREAERYFKELIDKRGIEGDFSKGAIRAAVLSLVAYLAQNYAHRVQTNAKGDREYVKSAIEYIDANLSRRFTIDDIAEYIGISKYHFAREFKRVTGYTPIVYINMKRCNIAKIMLKDRDRSMSYISSECGFESPAYFSKMFKKYFGISPKQFREQLKKEL